MPRRFWGRLAMAVALVTVAALVRIWPLRALGSDDVWLTFYPALIFAAIYGGLASGLTATGLSFLAVLILWPNHLLQASDWLGAAMFLFSGVIISYLGDSARTAKISADVLRTLVSSVDEGFCVIEMIYDDKGEANDYRFVATNPAFLSQTGLTEALHKTMKQMVPEHDSYWFEIYGKVAKTGHPIRFEHAATAMSRYYDVFAFRIGAEGSNRVGILFKDISARKQTELDLIQTAHYDRLTGLPNRRLFQDLFTKSLSRAERAKQNLALLFLDLDGFKGVNDTHGHSAGDMLLQSVAQRLTANVRTGDMVSRLGGDEFTILVENCHPKNVKEITEKIIREIETPFDVGEAVVKVSASIGIATFPECGATQDALLQMADAAMYAAKKDGGQRYRFWRPPPVAETEDNKNQK
jgi:diguanylate cyclase (GGDEF)-like protein